MENIVCKYFDHDYKNNDYGQYSKQLLISTQLLHLNLDIDMNKCFKISNCIDNFKMIPLIINKDSY